MMARGFLFVTFGLSGVLLGGLLAVLAQPQPVTVLKITDFQTAGDGNTDDTAALQKAIDTAVARHATLEFPPGPGGGCYASGSLTIKNADHVTLRGTGGVLCWKGGKEGAPRIGLGYAGDLTNVTIEGLEITGAGPDVMFHSGIAGPSGSNLKNIVIQRNYIHDVSLGISLNADEGGTLDGFLIAENKVENVVGWLSGYGYGIHDANGSGKPSNGKIVGNTLIGCQRNTIYQAKGSGVVIANNVILDHGRGRPRQNFPLTGIQVARGSDILVINNRIEGAQDGSLEIGTDHQIPIFNITVINNRFLSPKGALPAVTVGSARPDLEGTTTDVKFIGNLFIEDGVKVTPIEILSGKRITFAGNSVQIRNAPAYVPAIAVHPASESAGTATYSDQLVFTNNEIDVGSAPGGAGFEISPGAAASGITMHFSGNQVAAREGDFHMPPSISNRNLMMNKAVKPVHLRQEIALNATTPAAVPGCSSQPVRLAGVAPGDFVRVSPLQNVHPNFILEGSVTAPGEVTVKWCELYGVPADPDGPAGGRYQIDVWPK